MPQANFRFYAELNDFLPTARRQVEFAHAFQERALVKDVIEALGVPHTEVDLILVNGAAVDFAYRLRADDRVSVYPVFELLDITPLVRLRPRPLRVPKFVLDTHLGRLARYLRLLGFDTRYQNDASDEALAHLSANEHRILLTKDLGLLKRRVVQHGYIVRADKPAAQLREVVRHYDLFRLAAPFTRCLTCNGRLEPVAKDVVAHRLPPRARAEHDEFQRCQACDRVYWPGSHHARLQRLVAEVLDRR